MILRNRGRVFGPAGTVLAVLAGATVLAAQPAWLPQASGVTARLRGVSAVSDRVVWASGSGNTILRTEDGGTTWTRLESPTPDKLDFRDIDAVDERTAYVLSIGEGPASRIFKTTDAGRTWQRQFQNEDPRAFFDAMAFSDRDHGVAISDSVDGRFVMLLTSNGGGTWARVPADRLPAAQPNEGYFAASGTNVTVRGHRIWMGTGAAAKARVLRSPDRGRTWQVADTPVRAASSSGIYSIAFRDDRHGVVVGGDYARETDAVENAATTSDGGATWTLVGSPGLSGFRSVVAHVPGTARTFIALGPRGGDISHDDGRTWKPLEGPGVDTFSFVKNRATGWGAGAKGTIARLELPRASSSWLRREQLFGFLLK
jgi:photosystem II stability/assembly factor-like uncharacterized protein